MNGIPGDRMGQKEIFQKMVMEESCTCLKDMREEEAGNSPKPLCLRYAA